MNWNNYELIKPGYKPMMDLMIDQIAWYKIWEFNKTHKKNSVIVFQNKQSQSH